MIQRARQALASSIAAHPVRALLLVAALALAAVWPAGRLGLDTDPRHALPSDLPAARAFAQLIETFGGLERAFVIVEADPVSGGDPEELAIAADALATSLLSSAQVARAASGPSPADERFLRRFVLERAPLLLDSAQRSDLRIWSDPDRVRDRVDEIRRLLTGPGGLAHRRIVTSDLLGIGRRLADSRSAGVGLPLDATSLTFMSPERDAALVVVTPSSSRIDPEAGRALLADLETAYAAAREAVDRPLRFSAIGGPLYAAHDEQAIREDLQRTALGTAAVVAVLLIAFFGSVAVPLATLFSVAVGLLWTAALTGVALGRVTAIGIGLTSILIGLGVDYGLHGASRFLELRGGGSDPEQALRGTFRSAGPGILVSAATTAVAFSVLAVAGFRPLREMGVIVALGIVAIFVATLVGGSAWLVLTVRRPPRRRAPWQGVTRVVHGLAGLSARRPSAVLLPALVLTVASLAALPGLDLDFDPRRLRPVDHPAFAAEERLGEIAGMASDTATLIVDGPDLDRALGSARSAAALLRESLGESGAVHSPSDWLLDAETIRRRLDSIAAARLDLVADRFEIELAGAGFNVEAFSQGLRSLRALGRGDDPGRPGPSDWPEWLAESIHDAPGSVSIAVHARLPEGQWPEGPPDSLVRRLADVAPGSSIASASGLGAELRGAALADLSRLAWIALLAVLLVVGASLRGSVRATLLSLAPALLGVAWTFGLWSVLGRPLDLFGLAVLPIFLGIGIDDGLHAVHGGRQEHGGDVRRGVILAGRPIVVTSLTTSLAFASLTLSRVPALANGGALVSLGVLACLVSTLVVLPALGGRGPVRSR